jgi:hypothetical protein
MHFGWIWLEGIPNRIPSKQPRKGQESENPITSPWSEFFIGDVGYLGGRGDGRWPFLTLVAGLSRPLPARTFPQTLPNSQRTLPRHPGLSRNRMTNAAIEAVNGLL